MEDVQRNKVLLHINYLAHNTINFQSILDGLKEKRLFSNFMSEEILGYSTNEEERCIFLYSYITTRGPDSFPSLCEVLRETGNGLLADILCDKSDISLEAQYPFDKTWIVTKAITRMDSDTNKVYKMSSRKKGLALIININRYVNDIEKERKGSEVDIDRLNSVFQQLDYEVTIHRDITANEMRIVVKEFAADEGHAKCDSSIVVVMSHGANSVLSETVNLKGQDGGQVNSAELIKLLMAYACKSLQGKPKIFLFQACRGDNFNFPVLSNGHSQSDHSQATNGLHTDGRPPAQPFSYNRSDSDILIGYSTSPGFVSFRDPVKGSWYIQTICRVFAKYAWEYDLVTLLETVDNIFANMSGGDRQTSTVSNTLTKKLYFQPGISIPPDYQHSLVQ